MFNTIDDVYSWLYYQKKKDKRQDLSRIERCCRLLSLNPSYPIIHIAGTNGKGSTAAYIKEILSHTGRHVGFFVSPFVISFNERIQVNERYISNAEILYYSNILYEFSQAYNKEYDDIIPFFELTLLMALMFFRDRSIDLAVIECGLGGKLDATNFLKCDLAIITNIGYDHMLQLGSSLPEIASHKLGIVKPGMTCFTAVDEPLRNQFLEYAALNQAKMQFVKQDVSDIRVTNKTEFTYKNEHFSCNLLGEYQAYNAALAIEAVRFIEPNIPYDLIDFGLNHVFWPGRMEILQSSPLILLDGGHNIPAMEALTNTVLSLKKDKKVKVLFTALMDKAYPDMLKILDSVSDFYYFTSIPDLRKTDATIFKEYTNKPSQVIDDYKECLMVAHDELKKDEILLICGSLHFISMIRENFLKNFKA